MGLRLKNLTITILLPWISVCVGSVEYITGRVNETVLLPCHFDSRNSNIKELVITWQLPETNRVVHSFYEELDHPEYQAEEYKGRTQLFLSECIRGNATLQIMSLILADSGEYICFVHTDDRNDRQTHLVNLNVTEPDNNEVDSEAKSTTSLYVTLLLVTPFVLGLIICFRMKQKKKHLVMANTSKMTSCMCYNSPGMDMLWWIQNTA
ncbi:myelin-oligodendrocyte glycoprotein-like [Protopterus annectens]|uniref:myelin-oligodendrocyte glycoprotein-like n=1 Tax=Protopterus annectens TaxID=7888 RepID=UPI001CFB65EC|nr:myelin-oligodendrocyte glycoprotein-like [Protopterus annectens]XP_043944516.1 myelin-oligodendrocyte glycoprotein-like [Protopterus annectens]XP_043944517.1 myelin-oligodendrocyte glycoprotein-like [Protopterus annectens]XP_043944518.1 myelin-oligodendrocyte glycoprotein-like [Protopterus annectens]